MIAKLMKYELIRKKTTFSMFLAVMLLMELAVVYLFYRETDTSTIWAIVLFFFLLAFAAIFLVYDNIKLLSDDLNKKSGYMLFLTPNNGFRITASKMIIGLIEVLIVVVFLVGFFYVNFNVADSIFRITVNPGFLEMKRESLIFSQQYFGVGFWVYMILSYAADWFTFIITVYLAIILRKTLFSNVRYKGLMSFLVFIAINIAIGVVSQIIFSGFFFASDIGGVIISGQDHIEDIGQFISFIKNAIHVGNVLNLLVAVGGFWLCGWLLTKKVDL